MFTKEIKSAAKDEGIAWATLRRAKERMRGVKADKENKARGKWLWYLEEFTKKQALVEADAKARVEVIREKHQAEERLEELGMRRKD